MTLCALCPGKTPRQADEPSLLCFPCSNRILRHLRELEDYLPTLSLVKTVKSADSRGAPGFGSRSPANDTAIHHTDWRSGWDALDGLGAVATIHSWANAVREDRAFQQPKHINLSTEISALRNNHAWIVCQPFVDEYARELREVYVAVRAAANDPVPQAMGKCINMLRTQVCGGTVYELSDFSGVKCSSCNRIYTGLDLDRLRVAQEGAS